MQSTLWRWAVRLSRVVGVCCAMLGAGGAQAVTIQPGEIWDARITFPTPSFPPEITDPVVNLFRIDFNLGADPLEPGETLRITASSSTGTILIDQNVTVPPGNSALLGGGADSAVDPAPLSGLVYDLSISVTGGAVTVDSLFGSLAFVGPPVERCIPGTDICFTSTPFPVTGAGPIDAEPLLVQRPVSAVPLPAPAFLLVTAIAALGALRLRNEAG